MKLISYLLPFTIMTLLTGFGRQTAGTSDRPAEGTSRTITTRVSYYSGKIEGSQATATWPVAKFAADEFAISYSVKEMKSGKIFSWQTGDNAQCAYHVFPSSGDIKNGSYYIGLGRTWSAEASSIDPAWENNYRSSYGEEDIIEVTFYY